jgi:uncharacterized protein DUF6542
VSEPAVSEPAGPLPAPPFVETGFDEPLFEAPLFEEPLFPDPRFGEPLVAAMPERAIPEPMAPELAIVELIGSASSPWQPAAADPTPAASAASQPRPQTAGRVVSGRGVTGRGVIVMISILTGLVGVLEVAFAGHRGAAFAVAFVLTSAIGALVVRRRDLPTSVIAPPLLYCVLIVVLSIVDTHDQSGGFVTRKAVYIGNAFVTGAPTLWAGAAAAGAIAWYRRRAGRRPRN